MAIIEINWKPDRRHLREFGCAAAIAFAAIGAWIFFRHSLPVIRMNARAAHVAAYVFWAAAAACGVLAAAAPPALRPLYIGLTLAGLPIGWVVSHVVLAAVFYLVLTPIGLVMRLMGRDPLQRRRKDEADTYWVRREPPADAKRYFRQF